MMRSELSLCILDMCCDPGRGDVGGVGEKRAEREKTTQFKQKFDFDNLKWICVIHMCTVLLYMSIYSWCVNNV